MVNLDHSTSVANTEGHSYGILGDEILEENQFFPLAVEERGSES